MWHTRNSIKFWGASNLAQKAGIAVLSEEGQKECQDNINYYLTNARLLLEALEKKGLSALVVQITLISG